MSVVVGGTTVRLSRAFFHASSPILFDWRVEKEYLYFCCCFTIFLIELIWFRAWQLKYSIFSPKTSRKIWIIKSLQFLSVPNPRISCIYVCTWIFVCVRVALCMSVWLYACACVCMFVRVCLYVFVCVCMCLYTCVFAHVCVCTCMFVCAFVCVCVTLYECVFVRVCLC